MGRNASLSAREIERIRQEGFAEGVQKGHQEALDFLQVAYIGPNAPERGSVEGEAILKLARELSSHLKHKRNRRR